MVLATGRICKHVSGPLAIAFTNKVYDELKEMGLVRCPQRYSKIFSILYDVFFMDSVWKKCADSESDGCHFGTLEHFEIWRHQYGGQCILPFASISPWS